jgi:two-component system chemotaxis sensor kinase CheA
MSLPSTVALVVDTTLDVLLASQRLAEITVPSELFDELVRVLCDIMPEAQVGIIDHERALVAGAQVNATANTVMEWQLFGPAGESLTLRAAPVPYARIDWVGALIGQVQALCGTLATYQTLESMVADEMATVVKRESSIQLILDSMVDGLLVCTLTGELTEIRSASAQRWFGDPQPGDTLWMYLRRDNPEMAAMLQVGFEQLADDFLPFEVAAGQIGDRFCRDGNWFGLSFDPVLQDGVLTGIVATVSDANTVVAAERAEEDSREMLSVIKQFVADPAGTRAGVDELQRLLSAIDEASADRVLSDLHTLKGNSAALGLSRMARTAHEAETAMANGVPSTTAVAPLQLVAQNTRERMDTLFGNDQRLLQISPSSLEEVLAKLDTQPNVHGIVRSWQHASMHSLLHLATRGLDKLALERDKDVNVEIKAGNHHAPSEMAERFLRTISHVVRNAVAHGIESVDERVRLGKPVQGQVRLECWRDIRGFTVQVSDDGAGIAWERIRQVAIANGVEHYNHDDLLACLVTKGVSTQSKADELSGRGQGMAAVLEALTAAGGHLLVDSEPGRGTTWTFVMNG